MIKQQYDQTTVWSNNSMIKQQYDQTTVWSNNSMIKQQYDQTTVWSSSYRYQCFFNNVSYVTFCVHNQLTTQFYKFLNDLILQSFIAAQNDLALQKTVYTQKCPTFLQRNWLLLQIRHVSMFHRYEWKTEQDRREPSDVVHGLLQTQYQNDWSCKCYPQGGKLSENMLK